MEKQMLPQEKELPLVYQVLMKGNQLNYSNKPVSFHDQGYASHLVFLFGVRECKASNSQYTESISVRGLEKTLDDMEKHYEDYVEIQGTFKYLDNVEIIVNELNQDFCFNNMF
jgi:hypothetical protein